MKCVPVDVFFIKPLSTPQERYNYILDDEHIYNKTAKVVIFSIITQLLTTAQRTE